MIRRQFNDIANNPHEDLRVLEEFPNCVTVEYTPPRKEINASSLSEEEKKHALSFKHELMMINGQDNFISISPIVTFPDRNNFLHPKYERIESITLQGFHFTTPETVEDVLDLLHELPTGFIKGYEYGLGFNNDLRFIIHTVEKIQDVKFVVISAENETNVSGNIYTLNYSDFETVRKGINRIADTYQSDARLEKSIFSYNMLLHQMVPEKYQKKKKPYKRDIIHKFVSGREVGSSSLSKPDIQAVIKMMSGNKNEIYSKEREKTLQLQQGIELINLEFLIKEMEGLLSKKSSENKWQNILNDNTLIQSLIICYLKIQDQVSVGGRKLSGKGEKISDFLIKNNLTDNTALIEIKTPKTPLLQKREYRGGVYGPSADLSGSVTQILDQKYKFQTEISIIKVNSEMYDIETYSVDCVLIIGTIPSEKEKKKCFELYRRNLKDVQIYTFDELLNKLKDIYSAFKPESDG